MKPAFDKITRYPKPVQSIIMRAIKVSNTHYINSQEMRNLRDAALEFCEEEKKK
ncbi:MAG: hypothetical protein KAS32_07150 [Candidatus Peribacteraceae bacterium]|nr:hypothetical protein [Candidatus Peribacteraceae bacterium]